MKKRALCIITSILLFVGVFYPGGLVYAAGPSLTATVSNGSVSISLSGYSGSSAKVAVWSETNGQDDLVWYTMTKGSDGVFRATADASVFKHTGTVWAHAYNGSTFLCEVSFNWSGSSSSGSSSSTPSLKTQANGSNYDIILSGYSGSSAKVAVWSENNGQDDLVWYTMTKNSDGTFSATAKTSVFKHTGVIWAHAYSGSTCLCELSFTWSGSSSSGSSSSGSSSSGSSSSTPSLKTQANGSNYDIILSGYSGSSAKVAVWSESNGQDDLVWYTMTKNSDGTFSATAKTSVFKHTGVIWAHAYSGSTCLCELSFTWSGSSSSGSSSSGSSSSGSSSSTPSLKTQANGSNYDIILSGYSGSSAKVAVWSETDGQDDLVWYTMTKNSDGTFSVTAKASSLKHNGTICVHAYNGSTYICETSFSTSSGSSSSGNESAETSITVEKISDTSYKITVKNALVNGKAATEVKIPTWTNDDQDDIQWIDALKNSDGSWSLTVSWSDFENSGKYTSHVYAYAGSDSVLIDGVEYYIHLTRSYTSADLDVMANIIKAVETGGQIYGSCRYDDFTPAYKNSAKESAITIGSCGWYGNEAKELLLRIQEEYPETFTELDTAGIAEDLLLDSWSAYGSDGETYDTIEEARESRTIDSGSEKAAAIQNIISSEGGIAVQNEMIKEQMASYLDKIASYGVDDLPAQMFLANLRHLGGETSMLRILNNCKDAGLDLVIDNIRAIMENDKDDDSSDNQVGDEKYQTRNDKVEEWIRKYIS